LPAPDVVTLTNGAFAENCYVVADPVTKEAVIVDPGEEAQLFLARIDREGWTPTAVWLTHAHLDHVAGVAAVKAATGVKVWLHPLDRPLYDRVPEQGAMFGLDVHAPPEPDGELAEGQQLTVGGCRFEVLHTPGHTPGHVTFVGHGLAIAGDVLFRGSIGRTDLPGGDSESLVRSIKKRLYTLPDATTVLPGHGPATSIGEEKRTNPFVRLTPGVDACLNCGAEVRKKPWGCKNPCPNCGFVYPLGDCSD
jgi:glyoxylase-like metal-dependent hydrolase (beta-lactamase superfamily II)